MHPYYMRSTTLRRPSSSEERNMDNGPLFVNFPYFVLKIGHFIFTEFSKIPSNSTFQHIRWLLSVALFLLPTAKIYVVRAHESMNNIYNKIENKKTKTVELKWVNIEYFMSRFSAEFRRRRVLFVFACVCVYLYVRMCACVYPSSLPTFSLLSSSVSLLPSPSLHLLSQMDVFTDESALLA